MLLVERRVQRLEKEQDEQKPAEQWLSELRDTPAWVLLGEPGAGKTTAFKEEARLSDGVYLTVRDLLYTSPLPGDWTDQTLFIDALDEMRASGEQSPLWHIANQLRNVRPKAFRLSCRAADWQGASDRMELERFSPDGPLPALQLCSLTDEDIRQILQANHGVSDPAGFVEQAERHRIAPLLRNPKMLELMAKAVQGGQWPETTQGVYQLACEKLAQENNREHRNLSRKEVIASPVILLAAGQLFAVLLLSGKTGVALDQDAENTEYATLEAFQPTDSTAAERAMRSGLFAPATGNDERLIPCHRTIAEYLAARWLADQLDRKALPQGRLLNLLLGFDGGVVADLRGLFAWLALCSTSIRARLIDVDPLGIVLYGDVGPFSPADKRQVLQALRKQAEQFPGFLRQHWLEDISSFGALADAALLGDFQGLLQTTDRDLGTQVHIDCVLDILWYGGADSSLADALLAIIEDASFRSGLRHGALRIWLKLVDTAVAKELLQQIFSGQVEDAEDEFLGKLLAQVYPVQLVPDELLHYLRPPKSPRLYGSYRLFWGHILPRSAPAQQLPELLAGFSNRRKLSDPLHDSELSRAAGRMLVRALQELDDQSITDEQLFAWLAAGADEYGHFSRDAESEDFVRGWLEQHPDRYRAMLAQCIQATARDLPGNQYSRLYVAKPPADIGLWHLQEAENSDESIARIHLQEALLALQWQRGAEGLSLDTLVEWVEQHPEHAAWLEKRLFCEWREGHRKNAVTRRQQARVRQARTELLRPELAAIACGTADMLLIGELADIWLNLDWEVTGSTLQERLASYSDLGDELVPYAEAGFKACLQRADLPPVDDIIALKVQGQVDRCGLYLLGLQLCWQEEPERVAAYPASLMQRLLAFYLCDWNFGLDELAGWAAHMARQCPELFAEVLLRHASAASAAGLPFSGMAYQLSTETAYARVAQLAIPELLRLFPESADGHELQNLRRLLGAALTTAPGCLESLAQQKLASEQLNQAQQPLWLAVLALQEGSEGKQHLWQRFASLEQANDSMLLATELIIQGFQLPELGVLNRESMIAERIMAITPFADLGRRSGFVTPAMDLGHELEQAINLLGSYSTETAGHELLRLLEKPELTELQYKLQSTLDQQRTKRREAEFRFAELPEVVQILANRAPTSVADLTQLTLSHLDDIAYELRHANDDGYRMFWNVSKGKQPTRREENLCRDALLTRLRPRLDAHSIGIDPEVDHAGDKRADLELDYRNQLTLPIEIKRDDHRDLWTAARGQLMAQYAGARKAEGHGIFLVFWFGENGKLKSPLEKQAKPAIPEELKTMLEAELTADERQRIFVRVLDVSWPASAPNKRKRGKKSKATDAPASGPEED